MILFFIRCCKHIFIFVLQYLFRVFSRTTVVCCHLTNNLSHLFVKDKQIYNTSQLFVYSSSSWGIFTWVFFIRKSWAYLFYKGCGFHDNNWYMKPNLVLSCTLSAIHFLSSYHSHPLVKRVKLSIGLQASMSL